MAEDVVDLDDIEYLDDGLESYELAGGEDDHGTYDEQADESERCLPEVCGNI